MYLKQLDIIGFKSFPNKTSIKFSPGKTAIVGPNGCGKTNILDAVRWVMGEQKITLLRGSKMEEVIFNGSKDMAPLGMAEVTLTLINNRGVLPTEYSEVQISRRLYRSGEAEYLLNKVPCRLKDITELFYDTGAGAHSYSVIQQQMIDSVISDKAEDRRFLFEEAAGITKYKQRKKAALRKLEATEQDMLRLKDIYAEVKTQVNSLQRQQKKAERYKELSDQVRQWELFFASARLKNIEAEKRRLKDSIDKLNAKIIESDSGMNVQGAALEGLRSKQIDLDQQLSKVSQELYESTETAHGYEKEVSVLKEKSIGAKSLIERNTREIEALQKRCDALSEQAVDTGAVLNKLRAELETLHEELKIAQTVQAEADQTLLAAKNTKERENSQLIELERKISSGKTEDNNLKEQLDTLQKYLSELTSQIDATGKSRITMTENLETSKKTASQSVDKRVSQNKELKKAENELAAMKQALEDTAKELAAAVASKEACAAQRNLLKDLIFSIDGTDHGVNTVLELKSRWKGVVGTVAEKFTPLKGYEQSVEAALGEMSKYFICDSKETAENVIKYLKSENKGRVGLIVPTTGTINPVIKRPEINLPGFVGWLDSFVTTDEGLTGLMYAVLCHIAVFESWIDPKQILERLPYGFKAVSTEGLIYYRNTIVGGSSEGLQLFSRKAQLDELEKQIQSAIESAKSLTIKEKRLESDLECLGAFIQSTAVKIQQLDAEIDSIQKIIDETSYEIRLIENEFNRLGKEEETTKAKLTLFQQKQYSLGLGYGQLGDQKNRLMETLAISGRKLEEIEQAASAAIAKVSQLQISEVSAQSRIDQSISKINHTKELLNEIAGAIKTKTEEINTAEIEIENAGKKIAERETKLKLTFESRTEITSAQTELKSRHTELVQKVSELDKQVKAVRNEKDKFKEDHHQNEMKLLSYESESSSIIEKMQDEYDVAMAELEIANPDPNMPEAEAREFLTQEKESLKKFGAVNLLALEEFQSASERKEFLRKQLGDLESARNDLMATITKINKTARDFFEETFEKVKTNFQMLFAELFEGGEAGLTLENPGDPLESNIEITARPKGKKLQSITMMSGGERALTAISLLFSLYLVKPSAYCVLDEIDAPLDDSNCRRFLRLITKFANNTQFIIITHNKITMQATDNLYGVTMVQPGISQLVAVKFNEIETKDGQVVISVAPPVEAPETNGDQIPDKVVKRMTSTVTSPAGHSDGD